MLKIAQPGGPSKEGEEMLRTAADAGHTDAKAVLAVYLAETGPPEEEGRSSKAVELARQAGGGGGALDPGVWAAGLRRGGMSGMETLAAENVLKVSACLAQRPRCLTRNAHAALGELVGPQYHPLAVADAVHGTASLCTAGLLSPPPRPRLEPSRCVSSSSGLHSR